MNTNSQTTHAPSHLREQFQEWLDAFEPNRLHGIDIQPVASLLDALADCGDVLPADYCDQLEIPKGSTYAEAVADVRQWRASKQGQPATEPALESLDEAKARWDSLLGIVSTPQKDGFLLRSPTGFPLATMEMSEGPGGRYRPYFGQPVAAQNEWIKKQAARGEPETSSDVGPDTDEDNDLRERVFQLICDHWVDGAGYDAQQALGEAIHDGIVPVSDLLRPLIEGESGFWLEQMARTCFHLPNRDFEGADWAGLLEEIEDKAKPTKTQNWQHEGF